MHDTGDSSHAKRIGVPRSTASGWIKRDKKTVVSIKSHDHDIEKLECEVVRLLSQVAKLRAIVRLLFVVLKLSGFTWERFRVPNGANKLQILNSIGSAATVIPLRAILAFLRLSHSRYHAWNQADTCGLNKRILAQVDVVFSNYIIEAWWRMLKHQWLYLNELDSVETVRKLVGFYVEQHNTHVPHSAFKGWQTPDKMYFSKGAAVPVQLQEARIVARQARRESNLAQRCNACQPDTQIVQIDPKKTDTT